MEIVRLGAVGNTGYLPDIVIEKHTSVIWTERFQEPGDFELTTPYIKETLELLPEMTLISHRETQDVMMVENHSISTDADGRQQLIVTGRSADAFLENRHVEAPYGKKRKMAKNYSPRGAAAVLIWNAIDNSTDVDVTRDGTYPVPGRDLIPNVMVTDSVPAGIDPNKRWWLREGPLYPQLFDILIRNDIGLRLLRPPGGTATRVSVKTAPAVRGEIQRDVVTDISALQFNLFTGVDRSHTQGANERVIFQALHGDVLNAQYLFSVKDYKTSCEVMSGAGGADVHRNGTEAALTGWFRRVMSYDAGEPEIPEDATNAETTAIKNEFRADAEDMALRSLKKQRKVQIFNGDISPNAPYVFKTHYNLGDTVSLFGDYGQSTRMVVSEYTRTQDADGDRGYPGLIKP